jgi:AcrR family transcriptional regulator
MVERERTVTSAPTSVRDRRRERTREEILDAAWHLAERDGIAGLSLRDLAVEVGMRAPSLYTYFAGKAAIYDAMFAASYRQYLEVVDALEVDRDDPVGTVAAAIELHLAFCRASVPRYQLLFTRAIPGWEPSPEAYGVAVAAYERSVAQLDALGLAGDDAMDLLTALTSGMAAQQLANDPEGDRWVRRNRDAAEMFVSYVRSR